jgi:hypothetical protein
MYNRIEIDIKLNEGKLNEGMGLRLGIGIEGLMLSRVSPW